MNFFINMRYTQILILTILISFDLFSQKGDLQFRLFGNRSDQLMDRPNVQTDYAYLSFGGGLGFHLSNKIAIIGEVEYGSLFSNKIVVEPKLGSMSSTLMAGTTFFQLGLFNKNKISGYLNLGGSLQSLDNKCACFTGERYRMEYTGLTGLQLNYQLSDKWAFFYNGNVHKPISTTLNDPNFYMSNLSTTNTKDIIFKNSIGLVYKIERKEEKKIIDSDKDGVIDENDKCPNTQEGEPVNKDGCSDSQLDTDNDGVVNIKDKCPSTPKGEKVNVEGCSESQLDNDGDGVNNVKDKCPSTPKGEKVNADGCSEGQLDSDVDGVTNDKDNCPNEKGDINNNGCPVVVPQKIEKQVTAIANEINFITNKAELTISSMTKLNELILILLENTEMKIVISGHTDDVGSEESNFILSQKRAQAVLDYLAEKGVAKNRMTALAFGEQQLKQNELNDDARSKNRRVEIKIIK